MTDHHFRLVAFAEPFIIVWDRWRSPSQHLIDGLVTSPYLVYFKKINWLPIFKGSYMSFVDVNVNEARIRFES